MSRKQSRLKEQGAGDVASQAWTVARQCQVDAVPSACTTTQLASKASWHILGKTNQHCLSLSRLYPGSALDALSNSWLMSCWTAWADLSCWNRQLTTFCASLKCREQSRSSKELLQPFAKNSSADHEARCTKLVTSASWCRGADGKPREKYVKHDCNMIKMCRWSHHVSKTKGSPGAWDHPKIRSVAGLKTASSVRAST